MGREGIGDQKASVFLLSEDFWRLRRLHSVFSVSEDLLGPPLRLVTSLTSARLWVGQDVLQAQAMLGDVFGTERRDDSVHVFRMYYWMHKCLFIAQKDFYS